ncbi:hypothetical protein [Pedobacter metabolipauper]|uniref:Uncharacterized protein n=1 Tax=Pedobacter metabolipauper TaxID=425513 RepID=A0A4R6SZU9_9SPHI|nr:hypothetical protein [Pedobacter metabolipauper]TDQ12194.1 hypothetical protein ATK78_1328 [Pedobacter metabolipauper]
MNVKFRYKLMNRKRRFKAIPIPKVYIRVKFRALAGHWTAREDLIKQGIPAERFDEPGGMYCIDFGYKAVEHFISIGEYYRKEPPHLCKMSLPSFSGQGSSYKSLWRYISNNRHRIHPLDIVK